MRSGLSRAGSWPPCLVPRHSTSLLTLRPKWRSKHAPNRASRDLAGWAASARPCSRKQHPQEPTRIASRKLSQTPQATSARRASPRCDMFLNIFTRLTRCLAPRQTVVGTACKGTEYSRAHVRTHELARARTRASNQPRYSDSATAGNLALTDLLRSSCGILREPTISNLDRRLHICHRLCHRTLKRASSTRLHALE